MGNVQRASLRCAGKRPVRERKKVIRIIGKAMTLRADVRDQQREVGCAKRVAGALEAHVAVQGVVHDVAADQEKRLDTMNAARTCCCDGP